MKSQTSKTFCRLELSVTRRQTTSVSGRSAVWLVKNSHSAATFTSEEQRHKHRTFHHTSPNNAWAKPTQYKTINTTTANSSQHYSERAIVHIYIELYLISATAAGRTFARSRKPSPGTAGAIIVIFTTHYTPPPPRTVSGEETALTITVWATDTTTSQPRDKQPVQPSPNPPG